MNGQPETDAEVVSEGPKPPPPPPRVAELRPAPAGEAFSVFDGPVADAKNAKRKGAAKPRQSQKAKGKGATPPAAAAAGPAGQPGPDPELVKRFRAEAKAARLLKLYEQWQLGQVRGRYQEILEPANLEQLLQLLRYNPEELKAMAESLGEGMVENDVEFPWWAEFGSMFLAGVFARRAMLEKLEFKYQDHLKQKEAAAAAAPGPAKAA